jgi:hypothetical protein
MAPTSARLRTCLQPLSNPQTYNCICFESSKLFSLTGLKGPIMKAGGLPGPSACMDCLHPLFQPFGRSASDTLNIVNLLHLSDSCHTPTETRYSEHCLSSSLLSSTASAYMWRSRRISYQQPWPAGVSSQDGEISRQGYSSFA